MLTRMVWNISKKEWAALGAVVFGTSVFVILVTVVSGFLGMFLYTIFTGCGQ